eukprot:75751_1
MEAKHIYYLTSAATLIAIGCYILLGQQTTNDKSSSADDHDAKTEINQTQSDASHDQNVDNNSQNISPPDICEISLAEDVPETMIVTKDIDAKPTNPTDVIKDENRIEQPSETIIEYPTEIKQDENKVSKSQNNMINEPISEDTIVENVPKNENQQNNTQEPISEEFSIVEPPQNENINKPKSRKRKRKRKRNNNK